MSDKGKLHVLVRVGGVALGAIIISLFLLGIALFCPTIEVIVKNQTPIEKWGPLGVSFIPIEKRNLRFAYEVIITNVDYIDWETGYRNFASKNFEVVYVYKHGGVIILTNDFTKAVEYFDQKTALWKFLAKRVVPVLPH